LYIKTIVKHETSVDCIEREAYCISAVRIANFSNLKVMVHPTRSHSYISRKKRSSSWLTTYRSTPMMLPELSMRILFPMYKIPFLPSVMKSWIVAWNPVNVHLQ